MRHYVSSGLFSSFVIVIRRSLVVEMLASSEWPLTALGLTVLP